MGHLDADRHRGGLPAGGLDQRRSQGLQGLRLVQHLAFAAHRAAGVEHTHLVRLGRPVNSHVHPELLLFVDHCSPPLHRPPGRPGEPHRPCTGALWRNFPRDVPSGATCRGAVRLRRSWRRASMALSASRPRMRESFYAARAPPPLPQFSTSWRRRGATVDRSPPRRGLSRRGRTPPPLALPGSLWRTAPPMPPHGTGHPGGAGWIPARRLRE